MKKILFLQVLACLFVNFTSCDSPQKIVTLADSSLAEEPKIILDKGNGIFAIVFNNLSFEVDANYAARIKSFSLDGKNILSDKSVNALNWGTSFWPSPQAAWGWPPSLQLDSLPYSGGVNGNQLEFVSEKDPKLSVVFIKNYRLIREDSSVLVTYKIVNQSNKSQTLAAWEISRVAPGGLTFYPTGKGKKQGLLKNLIVEKNDISWFDYDSSKMNFKESDVPKLLHDGSEGWMAHLSENLILVKKFQDVSPEKTAPEEGEIEFYANPDKSYVEIEQQGPYTLMNPGDTIAWEVKWYLRKLPDSISGEVGNQNLANFVRSIIK